MGGDARLAKEGRGSIEGRGIGKGQAELMLHISWPAPPAGGVGGQKAVAADDPAEIALTVGHALPRDRAGESADAQELISCREVWTT